MPWSKEDRSFKILINKRVTNSDFRFYEEVGDNTLDISLSDIKTEVIPYNAPPSDNAIIKKYMGFELVHDNSVTGYQCYYAYSTTDATASSDKRLRDWISDKYGKAYTVSLLDIDDNIIGPAHPCAWFFDYTTGILTLNGDLSEFRSDSTGYHFKITGWRYIGKKGEIKGLLAVQTKTFAELNALVIANSLEPGNSYLLSDFATVYKVAGATATTINTATSESLLLRAKDNNSFFPEAYSTTFDQDIIRFDFTNQLAEDGVTPRKGKIIYREDTTLSISAYYDWRTVLYTRWILAAEPNIYYAEQTLVGSSSFTTRTAKTFDLTKTVRNVHLPATSLYNGYNNVIFFDNVFNNRFITSVTGSTFINAFSANTIETCRNSVFKDATENKMGYVQDSYFIGMQTYRNKIDVVKSTKVKVNFNDNFVFKLSTCTFSNGTFTNNTALSIRNTTFTNGWDNITVRTNISDITIINTRSAPTGSDLIFDYLISGKFINLAYTSDGNLETVTYLI